MLAVLSSKAMSTECKIGIFRQLFIAVDSFACFPWAMTMAMVANGRLNMTNTSTATGKPCSPKAK